MIIFYFVVLLLIPLTMIGIGYTWKKYPPKTINHISGYRTTMSMKNQETWEFAHAQVPKFWISLGWLVGIISVVLLYVFRNSNENTLPITVIYITIFQIIGMVIPLPIIEYKLKKNFNKDGTRKL